MKSLILIDLINDLVIKRGYLEKFDELFFARLSETINKARENGFLIIHVKVGFSGEYENQPKNSPIFGKAHESGILKLGTLGTEFYNKNDIKENDIIIEKSRVSPFYKTELDEILRRHNIDELFLGGIATELAISSCAREAHDRDYKVNIISDLTTSLNKDDYESELKILGKIAKIINSNDLKIGKKY